MATFWLRAETKENEFRRAIVPKDSQRLIEAGHTVYVEDWSESIIPIQEYESIGCKVVAANSWYDDAPSHAVFVGLKALPHHFESFTRTHLYFAHAYKQQDGWQELVGKFKKGHGEILDLEFMLDKDGRRVCAFGYWAGFVGAGLGALFARATDLTKTTKDLDQQKFFKNQNDFIQFIQEHTNPNSSEKSIVIGARGRSGHGAHDLFSKLKWSTTAWDIDETIKGGPFAEILEHDVFVNCVLSTKKIPPFIDHKTIESSQNSRLKIISDVSCDPDSHCNTVPLYKEASNLESPLFPVNKDISVCAIDNLPSILPRESSEDFSSQLVNYLIEMKNLPIENARRLFIEKSKII